MIVVTSDDECTHAVIIIPNANNKNGAKIPSLNILCPNTTFNVSLINDGFSPKFLPKKS